MNRRIFYLSVTLVLLLGLFSMAGSAQPAPPFAEDVPTPNDAEPVPESSPALPAQASDPAAATAHPAILSRVLWDQYANWNSLDYAAQEFGASFSEYDTFAADDFENAVPWSIDTIVTRGGWSGYRDLNNATAIRWWICPDNGGEPLCDPPGDGNAVWSLSLAPSNPQVQLGVFEPADVVLTLNTPISLPPGHWWLVYQVALDYDPYGQYGWSGTSNPVWGASGKQNNPGGGLGIGAGWVNNSGGADYMFRLEGNVTWSVLPAPPLATSRSAGAVDAAGRFYIIGGESSGNIRHGQVQRYDPATGVWDNTLATMVTPASNICAAVIGDAIYVPGGWTGSVYLTDLQVYQIGSGVWETIATDPLPGGRHASACAAYDGKLYVFGGNDGPYQSTAWVYDPTAPAGTRWTSLADVPIIGGYGAALAVGDLIFYAGMRNATANLPNVYAYDPATDAWTAYPDLNTARGAAGMWAIGDRLLVGGGGWSSYLTSVEQYDTTHGTGGSWSAFETSLFQGRRTFAFASDRAHGRLFAGNGWAGTFLAHAEQFESLRIYLPLVLRNAP